jgi:crossover junction endodeoxyribonuclease RuvC
MFVLGIDPGLSTTGYGIVDVRPASVKVVAAGTIRTDPTAPVASRLAELHADVVSLIVDHAPEELAIEEVFVNRNLQTATTVGRASGVVLLAAAAAGIPVFEYTPTAVKRAVTGSGRAGKAQVETMVSRRLGVPMGGAPADAYDALAVALCHAQAAPLRLAVRGGS